MLSITSCGLRSVQPRRNDRWSRCRLHPHPESIGFAPNRSKIVGVGCRQSPPLFESDNRQTSPSDVADIAGEDGYIIVGRYVPPYRNPAPIRRRCRRRKQPSQAEYVHVHIICTGSRDDPPLPKHLSTYLSTYLPTVLVWGGKTSGLKG